MNIRKRLVVSNVLMIAVPAAVALVTGLACLTTIWFTLYQGGMHDGEDFYKLSRAIAPFVEELLEYNEGEDLDSVASLLNDDNGVLTLTQDGDVQYTYGHSDPQDMGLQQAISAMGGIGFVSNGQRALYVTELNLSEGSYSMELYATITTQSNDTLKTAVIISGCVIICAILIAIWVTNRFLLGFVFRKITASLDTLSHGAAQLQEGNFDYRIHYPYNDEFTPVCTEFNHMVAALQIAQAQRIQQEESRKELLLSVSHDLRSPLTSIQAYVEGLLDGVAQTPDAQNRYLNTIKNKAIDMDKMLSQIFLFSKLEMGDYPDSPQVVQLDEEIRQLVIAVEEEYKNQGLELNIAVMDSVTASIDPDQFHRVMLNIINNSLKYKSKDIGKLTIALMTTVHGCDVVFTDDGPGVPQEALPHLFESFYRCDPARKNPHRGSGLGLAIVVNSVIRWGGSVDAQSPQNGGLTITIHLPHWEE